MSDEIINKVDQSPLITFNLEDLLPSKVMEIDIAEFLEGGFILREKEFRAALKTFDYSPYSGSVVRLFCSTDAILPAWAALLVASKLSEKGVQGIWASTSTEFFSLYYRAALSTYDFDALKGKPVIVKGCGDPRVPQDAYVHVTSILKPIAKKISYGEACSAVPLK